MNNNILNAVVQRFITDNINSDIPSILLKKMTFKGVGTTALIEQIESKKKCQIKLPSWFETELIYYPNKLNIEQTSSEIAADYKSQIIAGNSIVDITGGFGVDCHFFSKHFKSVVHCEIDKALSDIFGYNNKIFKNTNIEVLNIDGITYLKDSDKPFDWIYADPSRRHDSKGKVFFLKDCQPNIPEHLDILFAHSNNLMIKTSPLLDLSAGIRELNHVHTIQIVAINNEVKELLWILKKGFKEEIAVKTVNLKKDSHENFNFRLSDENATDPEYSLPRSYLYEPNAAILKAGAFRSVATAFNVYKLQRHSHLYTSDAFKEFPGRCFKIEKVISYNKRQFKRDINLNRANITTRNFPESVQQIRKKLNIKDGGDSYLFFTTDINNDKIVVVSSKINY